MQTDELRAGLADLANEVAPSKVTLPPSVAVSPDAGWPACRWQSWRSSPLRAARRALALESGSAQVAGSAKNVQIPDLPHLDAVVVLPAAATSSDVTRVQTILDNSSAVEQYTQLRNTRSPRHWRPQAKALRARRAPIRRRKRSACNSTAPK